uniref:Uncharacterized protein n=1 Tax=Ananas comosus var. bracteatus TaxID=296719 RepID=A0A6V7PWE0_ANACO|nr:unnamed protein product [Ananas comosus var. bracteatus]
MEMELKRTEMVLDSQRCLVDAFAKRFFGKKRARDIVIALLVNSLRHGELFWMNLVSSTVIDGRAFRLNLDSNLSWSGESTTPHCNISIATVHCSQVVACNVFQVAVTKRADR